MYYEKVFFTIIANRVGIGFVILLVFEIILVTYNYLLLPWKDEGFDVCMKLPLFN